MMRVAEVETEIEVDSFAGGGGVSEGLKMALGHEPAYAINHDEVALAVHAANHPSTIHLHTNIVRVDPRTVGPDETIGLGWFSPDCTDHSKAKGGVPVRKHIRDLGWVPVLWASRRRPRVIIVENVEEYEDWSPLIVGDDGELRRCPNSKGKTFKRWVRAFRREGYAIEWRVLRCCDYGAPTIRKRLFVIARCDGEPIVWPKPTHGDPKSDAVKSGKLKPWRTAAEIIDWSRPCYSIFMTREEARELRRTTGVAVQRPLKPNSMARFAKGVHRYVLTAAEPFIVPVTHGGDTRVHGTGEPLRTVTTANRGEHALVMPFVSRQFGASVGSPIDAPAGTVTAGGGGKSVLAAPFVTKFNSGSTGHPIDQPLHTVTAHSSEVHGGGASPLGVVAPFVTRFTQNGAGQGLDEPLDTVMAGATKFGVVAPFLVPRYGERPGQEPRTQSVEQPLSTVVPDGNGASVAAVFLAQNNYMEPGHDVREPLSTVVQKGCTQSLLSAGLINLRGADRRDADVTAPTPGQTGQGGHLGIVTLPVISKYYGAGEPNQGANEPLHTDTAKPRFGLLEVEGAFPPLTETQLVRARQVAAFLRSYGYWDDREFVTVGPWLIYDIGMRMLTVRERFNAHGFRPDYKVDIEINGKRITGEEQGRMVGNSVPPPMVEALVRANYTPREIVARPPRASEEFRLEAAE